MATREDSPPRTRHRLPKPVKVTAAILFTVWTVDYIDRLVLTIVLPQIGREFMLSNTQKGLLVSAFFLAYALAQIPGGVLTDRIGGRKIAGIAMLSWSAFTAFTGMVHSYGLLLAVRVLFGVAQAPFPAAATKILAERTTPDQRMSAQGIVTSSNGFGALIGYLTVPPLVVVLGWRNTFIGMAVLGAVCFLLLFVLPRRTQSEPATESSGTATRDRLELRRLLRNPALLTFAAMFFGSSLISWGVVSWMPSYLQDVRGVALGTSAVLLALPALAIAIGTYVGGRLTDRLGGATARIVTPAMVVSLASIVVMATTESLAVFVILECIAVFGCGVCIVPVVSVPLKALPTEMSGTAFSIVNFGGQMAGVVAPLAMGMLLDAFGYTAAFLFLAVGAALAAVLAVVAPQTVEAFDRRAQTAR